MILGVNIGLCFVLAIVQTTLFPYLGITETFYDLPALFVLYLGLFRSARESLPVVVFLGFIVDSLSGGPFGVYLSIYFWLFLSVRGSTRFLHIGFNALLPFILAVGVLLQNGMELLILTVVVPDVGFPAIPLRSILLRMAWAFLTGPLVHLAFRYLHRKSDQWRFQLFSEKNRLMSPDRSSPNGNYPILKDFLSPGEALSPKCRQRLVQTAPQRRHHLCGRRFRPSDGAGVSPAGPARRRTPAPVGQQLHPAAGHRRPPRADIRPPRPPPGGQPARL